MGCMSYPVCGRCGARIPDSFGGPTVEKCERCGAPPEEWKDVPFGKEVPEPTDPTAGR